MDEPALLRFIADLADRAAALILEVRARGFDTIHKHDQSPVTEADHAAERLIAAALREATPDIQVVAEEEAAAGMEHDPASTYWLVDPLDGTREFASGRNEFTVNIGLVRHGAPVLGVCGVPALGELFGGITAGDGRIATAWKRDASGFRPIRARRPPAEGLTVVASRHFSSSPELSAFLGARPVASVQNYGSALKIVRVAEGVADLYPRLGRTMEWDTAGPQAVLEAAGGKLTGLAGEPFTYGKPLWENGHFVCSGL